jgi:hypothetical protein
MTSTTYWQTENNRVCELICVSSLPKNGVSVYYFCNILLLVFCATFLFPAKWPISMLFESFFLQIMHTYGRLLAWKELFWMHGTTLHLTLAEETQQLEGLMLKKKYQYTIILFLKHKFGNVRKS